jgi:hypothetical protein
MKPQVASRMFCPDIAQVKVQVSDLEQARPRAVTLAPWYALNCITPAILQSSSPHRSAHSTHLTKQTSAIFHVCFAVVTCFPHVPKSCSLVDAQIPPASTSTLCARPAPIQFNHEVIYSARFRAGLFLNLFCCSSVHPTSYSPWADPRGILCPDLPLYPVSLGVPNGHYPVNSTVQRVSWDSKFLVLRILYLP